MPELPEVQTTVNGLNASIRGLVICNVWTDYDSKFHRGKDSIKDPAYFKQFKKLVRGAKVTEVIRLAKNILIRIRKDSSNSVILIHMKMTGHLLVGRFIHDTKADKWSPAPHEHTALSDPYNRFAHFVISLSNGKHMVLSDARKFAKVTLIDECDLNNTVHLAGIGPDPLKKDFTLPEFTARLGRRPNARIKQALMDQTIIAGVGNIYSDEALWRAGLHPEARVRNIASAHLKRLLVALRTVLSKGIDLGGDSMSDYRNIHGERGNFQEHHNVYQRKGQKCKFPHCRGIIVRKVVCGRSAHFCDTHQKLLNDRKA